MKGFSKKGKKNEFELLTPIRINLDKFKIGPKTNKVLVEVFPEDVRKTVGGIITYGLESYNWAGFATRRGIVIQACSNITIAEDDRSSQIWECDVEVGEGDTVYVNHFDAWNSYIFTDDNKRIMRLVPYNAIQLAIRGNEVIMCNGYVLYEQIEENDTFIIAGKEVKRVGKKYIENEGVVKYAGSLNRKYRIPGDKKDLKRTDYGTEELKTGDRFLIEDPRKTWDLESYAFAIFDNRKMYKIVQRWNISAIYPS